MVDINVNVEFVSTNQYYITLGVIRLRYAYISFSLAFSHDEFMTFSSIYNTL